MEKRVVKKCEDHLTDFKEKIQEWISDNEVVVTGKQNLKEHLTGQ